MDILANYLFVDRDKRIKYLQSDDNVSRWGTVAGALADSARQKNEKNAKPVKKSKQETPKTLQEKVKSLQLTKEIKPLLEREVEKLDRAAKGSTEYSMIADYLTWATDLPWNTFSAKEFELTDLKTNLDASHYGLDDVKEFVLEHFTIERITKNNTGSVLCFSGPPG
ncbi:MAG: hypothetical protein ACKO96_15665, partial [Flammeovirgaceae bacterium]